MTGRRSTGRQSTAVMANRAPKSMEDADPQRALWRRLDYFPTPPWAARAGAELVHKIDPGRPLTCWEPACGEGHMASALTERFARVWASDVHPYGFGQVHDFLDDAVGGEHPEHAAPDWIVTNPPFVAAGDFLRRGLQVAQRGVALLLRLSFLETTGRQTWLHGPSAKLTACAVFAERVPMQLGSWDPDVATATAYAWFVWRKPDTYLPDLAPTHPQLLPIWPGTRDRLHRAEDVRRFCAIAPAPLLEGGA